MKRAHGCVMCLEVAVSGALYRTVHRPRVAIRALPSVDSEIAHVLCFGEVFRGTEQHGWVRLCSAEAWARGIAEGHVLLHGGALGLGCLVERLPDNEDEELWPFAPALRRAKALGVPFTGGHLRPMDAKKLSESWLSTWHLPDTVECPAPWGGAPKGPVLALATLLRGVPAAVVHSFAPVGCNQRDMTYII